MKDSGHTWSYPEDFQKAVSDLEASRAKVKELESKLAATEQPMDELREEFPDRFGPTGAMDHEWFEKIIRPSNFIYVRHDKNSLAFTIQNGPVKEVGKNGCQVEDIIAVAKHIIEQLNSKFPCRENSMVITKLDEALLWSNKRTSDRQARNVEGLSMV